MTNPIVNDVYDKTASRILALRRQEDAWWAGRWQAKHLKAAGQYRCCRCHQLHYENSKIGLQHSDYRMRLKLV